MDPRSSSRGISIVVPNYNSSRFLSQFLITYEKYGGSTGNVELLVVDHSAPEEAEVARRLCERYGARYLWCQGNLAQKRNMGIENARYDVVFFTDSDCQLTPTTLSEHMRLADMDGSVGAMCGVVEFVGEDTWMWSVVERTAFLGSFSFAKRMPYAPWAGTGNLSVKRQVLQEIGGFDVAFLQAVGQALGGEDVDLGLRINKADYKIACNPKALVYHTRETWSTVRRMVRRALGYGRAHYHILVKHADQVGREYPRLAAVFLLVGIVLTVKAAITLHWFPFLAGLIYVSSTMIAQATMVLLADERSLRTLVRELVAHAIDLGFEFGILYESLRHRDTRGFWAKMIYSERQLVHERERKIIQCWSLTIGFLVLVAVAVLAT